MDGKYCKLYELAPKICTECFWRKKIWHR